MRALTAWTSVRSDSAPCLSNVRCDGVIKVFVREEKLCEDAKRCGCYRPQCVLFSAGSELLLPSLQTPKDYTH
eukprot:53478-Eustigmatos_ZCMA.PRE.1